MPNIIVRPGWYLPEKRAVSESGYRNRRRFLKEMGFSGLGAMLGLMADGSEHSARGAENPAAAVKSTNSASGKGYPFVRNPEFNPANLRLSDEEIATSYNNFYEFSTTKTRVKRLTGKFVTTPWDIAIDGLVEKPLKLSVEEIVASMPIEERVYRFRCVEAWSMVVPWSGFPLSKLLERAVPKSGAKFVKFTTFFRPEQAPGFVELSNYPWPYTEGLRMDEAMNPLTLVATGIFGKPLPKQNGAPIRIVVPWKYGYKSIKSIVKLELVAQQPKTLWESLAPAEYPFESNVNPRVPHPRWSQATERVVDTGNRINTQLYNGYSEYVAKLYAKA
ncbi:MAG TPA: protein-methionine-sulfoxide reductase catalytic subunit MsrP [Verrucomicrobiae bacterium]|nr:protein-methionine-sulfoxide reductase catalytic subunit MsrP [Verrucomicrobiae bacterium]